MAQARSCPPRHDFSESTLLREQRAFRFSDQATRCVRQLLTLLHKVLRRFPYGLRNESDFNGYHYAAVHMPACTLCQVATTPRAEVRVASERIGDKVRQPETQVAAQAVGDGVTVAIVQRAGRALPRSACEGSCSPRGTDGRRTTR